MQFTDKVSQVEGNGTVDSAPAGDRNWTKDLIPFYRRSLQSREGVYKCGPILLISLNLFWIETGPMKFMDEKYGIISLLGLGLNECGGG